MAQKAEVLRDQALQQPVPLFGLPLCAAGKEHGARGPVCGRYANGDQGAHTRRDGRALDEKFDRGVSHGARLVESVANADELIAVAAGKTLGAVLIGGVGLGYAKRRECRHGCSPSSDTQIMTGVLTGTDQRVPGAANS